MKLSRRDFLRLSGLLAGGAALNACAPLYAGLAEEPPPTDWAAPNFRSPGATGFQALSRLTFEDQIFVIAFIRVHGSIKEMEELFGISYPTVKNRLNRIAQLLEFVEVNPPTSKSDILEQLEKGEITVEEATQKLREEQ